MLGQTIQFARKDAASAGYDALSRTDGQGSSPPSELDPRRHAMATHGVVEKCYMKSTCDGAPRGEPQ